MARITGAIKNPTIVVSGLTIFGAILRLNHLGTKPLWRDEAVLYWIARSKWMELVAQNALRNSAPPLFAILLHFELKLGDSETILRILPWLAGVASLPAIYYLMRQFLDVIPSYFVTFVLAISLTQIIYSQELREYSLTFLLSTGMLAVFYKYLQQPTRIVRLLLTFIMVAGVFTQYGLVLLIISLNIVYGIHLISVEDRTLHLKWWCASQIFVLAAAAVVYFTSLKQQWQVAGAEYLSGTYWDGSINSLWNFVSLHTLGIFTFAFDSPIFLFVALIGLAALLVDRPSRPLLRIAIIPLILALIMGLARLYPYAGIRQDMYLMPSLFILFGAGLGFLLRSPLKWFLPFLVVGFLTIAVFHSETQYFTSTGPYYEDMRAITDHLSRLYKKGDLIYLYWSAEPAFTYYYRDPTASVFDGAGHRGNPEGYYQELDGLLSSRQRVWLVFSHCYSNECQLIPAYASKRRQVETIVSAPSAYLYLVH